MKRLIILLFVLCLQHGSIAQKKPDAVFQHIEPPLWWVGMKTSQVQILLHSTNQNISDFVPSLTYQGVKIANVAKVENPHYLFLTLDIAADTKPGLVPIKFSQGKKNHSINYELRAKNESPSRIQGFSSSDVVYLIMPDRFANGDPKNDAIPGMLEGPDRSKGDGRHGGDLIGITNHLDYLDSLGVTALWLNPVLENDQPRASYHGYAITDLYHVDRRFGGNDAYLSFIEKSRARGLKVIQDMVMNHIGSNHWLMKDLPEKNWIHQFPEFTRSNYRGGVISDPYRSEADERKMSDGWFDNSMPDVDQTNPLFARYLIQNTLWWIEYAGIDGIRMDTYPYPDKGFMAEWAKEVMQNYPRFSIVGEVWLNYPTAIAYWSKGTSNRDGYQSHLPSVTDFPFTYAVHQAVNEPGGWDSGLARLYNLLTQDFVYPNANSNLTFLDNHDMSRWFLIAGRDIDKYKLGLVFLLTTRGIPQIYYGTELLMDGDGGHHPNVRLDFPGGWPDDVASAFTKRGRTPSQNDAADFLTRLLRWRKEETVIHTGQLMHFIPEDNVYVYFRYNEMKTFMIVLNGNDRGKKVDVTRFQERILTYMQGVDVLTHTTMDLRSLEVRAKQALILQLK